MKTNLILKDISAATTLLNLMLGAVVSADTMRTLTVDDDRGQLAQANFTSLSAAVAAAAPGDRILVYPGIYEANFTVDKELTIDGPKSGQDARTRPVAESEEAILESVPGGRLVLDASHIVLDGFLLRLPTDSESEPPGILLTPAASGSEIVNNLFDQTGLEAGVAGTKRTWVSRNLFRNNGDFFGLYAVAAAGIMLQECDFIDAPVWFGDSDGVVVGQNSFSGPALRDETATLHLRGCRYPVVQANSFAGQANLGLTELQGASVRDNAFVEGGIWITLSNQYLVVERNRVERSPVGIRLHNEGPGPSGAVVRFNQITDGDIGVLLSGDAFDNLIQSNSIANQRVGIQVSSPAEAFSGFNMIRSNTIVGSSEYDCLDLTTGSGTAGTANLWKSNIGATSSPAGLCRAR